MSDEAKIFRGDHDPQIGAAESAPRPRRQPPAQPQPVQSTIVPEPVPAATAGTVQADDAVKPVVPPVAAAKVEPELDFHIDESQLWHSSEAVKKRISEMASVAHQTAHLLDEQAEEAARIAQRIKSI